MSKIRTREQTQRAIALEEENQALRKAYRAVHGVGSDEKVGIMGVRKWAQGKEELEKYPISFSIYMSKLARGPAKKSAPRKKLSPSEKALRKVLSNELLRLRSRVMMEKKLTERQANNMKASALRSAAARGGYLDDYPKMKAKYDAEHMSRAERLGLKDPPFRGTLAPEMKAAQFKRGIDYPKKRVNGVMEVDWDKVPDSDAGKQSAMIRGEMKELRAKFEDKGIDWHGPFDKPRSTAWMIREAKAQRMPLGKYSKMKAERMDAKRK
jgi:hypothetical protein